MHNTRTTTTISSPSPTSTRLGWSWFNGWMDLIAKGLWMDGWVVRGVARAILYFSKLCTNDGPGAVCGWVELLVRREMTPTTTEEQATCALPLAAPQEKVGGWLPRNQLNLTPHSILMQYVPGSFFPFFLHSWHLIMMMIIISNNADIHSTST